jgi:hypothetical protein
VEGQLDYFLKAKESDSTNEMMPNTDI